MWVRRPSRRKKRSPQRVDLETGQDCSPYGYRTYGGLEQPENHKSSFAALELVRVPVVALRTFCFLGRVNCESGLTVGAVKK